MKASSRLQEELAALASLPGCHVYTDVAAERLRATIKHAGNSIELAPYDDHARWWPVVIEEVGEVARAWQESPEHLYEELIQTTAMFAAWADATKAALDEQE